MNQQLIADITKEYMKNDVPEFRAGDTVKVYVRIKEGEKERIQLYEGLVIKRRGGGISETFTVRKKSGSVGVNRVFPLNSPLIDKITVVKKGKVRRAKLNFLKKFTGTFRIKERKFPPSFLPGEGIKLGSLGWHIHTAIF